MYCIAKGDVSGQRAMEEEDTVTVSCCRQPSEEEGRLERDIYMYFQFYVFFSLPFICIHLKYTKQQSYNSDVIFP